MHRLLASGGPAVIGVAGPVRFDDVEKMVKKVFKFKFRINRH